MEPVIVIGAGLAGSEAAWQLAQRGVPVTLREMKPSKMTPAHHTEWFGELVCSNSLRSDQLENAVGLLKEELRRMDSLILSCADAHRVEAGGALAVDRHGFARAVTEKLRSHPLITVEEGEVTQIPESRERDRGLRPPDLRPAGGGHRGPSSPRAAPSISTTRRPPWSPSRAWTWRTPSSPPATTGGPRTTSTAP